LLGLEEILWCSSFCD